MIQNKTGKKKVLVLTSTYPRWKHDTIPPFVHELCTRLNESFEIFVVAPHYNGSKTNELMDRVKIYRFRYGPEKLEKLAYGSGMLTSIKEQPLLWLLVPFYLTSQVISCFYLIKKHKIQIIHAHWLIPQGLTALIIKMFYGRNIRVFLTTHGADIYALNSIAIQKLKAQILKHLDHIFAVSKNMESEIESTYKLNSTLSVAPMGIDFQKTFTPVSAPRSGILFVGRLVEKKGIVDLIQAFLNCLSNSNFTENLTIIGDGPLKPKLIKLIPTCFKSRFNFLGAIPNKNTIEHFQQAKLVVVPSKTASSGDQEGLGLVALEAIGCGTPVLLSDIDVFDEFSVAEFPIPRFSTGNINNLAEQIQNAINNHEELLSKTKALRKHAVAKYSWESSCEKYTNAFNNQL